MKAKTTGEVVEAVNSSNHEEEAVVAKTQPWFTPKKGSVIPAKRRLVRRIMFDSIVQFIASLLCSCGGSSSGVSITKPKNYSSISSKIVAQPNSSYGRKNAGM
ncbi:hypothetical protein I3842_Q054100 [Carya illinoinensis]|uniref:Uncharacterized protein n=1 Tax=Carya illinoinensis TaxID=32201 RepID=A0A922D360_CARIL|nr:hypothetical protein I3842_Q054100 [Carya illinoinensis]